MALNTPQSPSHLWLGGMVILVAAASELVGCATRRAGANVSAVSVLVYNIHAGKDARGTDNLTRVADLIRSSGADIVLLQEVDRMTTRSGPVDQAAQLRQLTGFYVAFGKSLDYQGGEYGIAIASRWPIVSDTMIPLPVEPAQERAGGSREPRGAIRAKVAAPFGQITVINTHIDASRDDRWRRQEIATVLSIASAAQAGSRNVLIGGDLNSTPESAVQQKVRDAGFVDAWQRCGRGEGLTYPADSAIKRIDYLYMSPDANCAEASVLPSDASDHSPLLVRLKLGFPRR